VLRQVGGWMSIAQPLAEPIDLAAYELRSSSLETHLTQFPPPSGRHPVRRSSESHQVLDSQPDYFATLRLSKIRAQPPSASASSSGRSRGQTLTPQPPFGNLPDHMRPLALPRAHPKHVPVHKPPTESSAKREHLYFAGREHLNLGLTARCPGLKRLCKNYKLMSFNSLRAPRRNFWSHVEPRKVLALRVQRSSRLG
jgi:hypothetical protein